MALREDVTLSTMLLVSVPVLVIAVGIVVTQMVPQFRKMQDRIDIGNVANQFRTLFSRPIAENGFAQAVGRLALRVPVDRKSVV